MRPGKITLNNYVLVKILCISHHRGQARRWRWRRKGKCRLLVCHVVNNINYYDYYYYGCAPRTLSRSFDVLRGTVDMEDAFLWLVILINCNDSSDLIKFPIHANAN